MLGLSNSPPPGPIMAYEPPNADWVRWLQPGLARNLNLKESDIVIDEEQNNMTDLDRKVMKLEKFQPQPLPGILKKGGYLQLQ